MGNSLPIFHSKKINKTYFFPALIRLNPAPNRLGSPVGSNQKPKKICVKILQINRIHIFSALVQSDGGRAIIGREWSWLTSQRQLLWAAWRGSSPFLATCAVNIKLWIAESSWGKFLPPWRICKVPFQEEIRRPLSDLCNSQEQKTTKFSTKKNIFWDFSINFSAIADQTFQTIAASLPFSRASRHGVSGWIKSSASLRPLRRLFPQNRDQSHPAGWRPCKLCSQNLGSGAAALFTSSQGLRLDLGRCWLPIHRYWIGNRQ